MNYSLAIKTQIALARPSALPNFKHHRTREFHNRLYDFLSELFLNLMIYQPFLQLSADSLYEELFLLQLVMELKLRPKDGITSSLPLSIPILLLVPLQGKR